MLAIGNEELGRQVRDKEPCPHCGKMRKVRYGNRIENGRKIPSRMLGAVRCGKHSYLVALNEQVVNSRPKE